MGRASRRKWLARVERAFLAGQQTSSGQHSLYESNLVWGPVSIVFAIFGVVFGLVVMLWLAWFVSWITIWAITQRISQPKCEPAYFVLGALTFGLLFYGVSVWAGLVGVRITVEGVDNPDSFVFGNKDSPAKVRKFAHIKVTNTGGKSATNVKAIVTRLNDRDWRGQLPLSPTTAVLFRETNAPPIQGSVSLNPGDDQHFYILVECNGMICPDGELAVPYTQSGGLRFFNSQKDGVYEKIHSVTVRVSGDGVAAVTKTFAVSLGLDGRLLLHPG